MPAHKFHCTEGFLARVCTPKATARCQLLPIGRLHTFIHLHFHSFNAQIIKLQITFMVWSGCNTKLFSRRSIGHRGPKHIKNFALYTFTQKCLLGNIYPHFLHIVRYNFITIETLATKHIFYFCFFGHHGRLPCFHIQI